MSDPTCPYCNEPAKLVSGDHVYPHRIDLFKKNFWVCDPCDARVGVHKHDPNFKPLGRLADAELRKAKQKAHTNFDSLWRGGYLSRKNAYKKLAEGLGIHRDQCHIGMFDVELCYATVEWSREYFKSIHRSKRHEHG